MKRLFLFLVMALLQTPTQARIHFIYRDHRVLLFCREEYTLAMLASVYAYNPQTEKSFRYGVRGDFPVFIHPESNLFSIGWAMDNHQMILVYPNPDADAMGRVVYFTIQLEPLLFLEKMKSDDSRQFREENNFPICLQMENPLGGCSSSVFSASNCSDPQYQVCWNAFSGAFLLARFPQIRRPTSSVETLGWTPSKKPVCYSWTEFSYDVLSESFGKQNLKPLHTNLVSPDGFDPVGAVRIAGKAVRTDAVEPLCPKDADWLIWEKNTNGVTRLCQMKSGRWSPVREVPRAPQTIVVDNDTETVHLLYDFAIDRADVDGSLRRLASLLKAPQSAP